MSEALNSGKSYIQISSLPTQILHLRVLLGEDGVTPMEEDGGQHTKRPAAVAPQQQSLENFLTSNVPEGAIILPPGRHFEIMV